MNGTHASEEPMDIPILSHFMLITGGEDDEAGLARDYGMQVDVVIGPSSPDSIYHPVNEARFGPGCIAH